MSSEINHLEAALIFLERAYDGRLSELGEKIGVSRPTVSVLLKRRATTQRNSKALIALWRKESGLETDGQEAKASITEAQPLGHIPFRGRDWSMDVPVYAEESLNDAVLRAVDRLLCVARGGTTAPSSPDKSAAEAITAPKNGLEFTGNTTSDGKRP